MGNPFRAQSSTQSSFGPPPPPEVTMRAWQPPPPPEVTMRAWEPPPPWWQYNPFFALHLLGKETLARAQGQSIQRPSGEMASIGPTTKKLSNPLAGQNWRNLIKFNPGYRNVLEIMDDPANPTWSAIAQKAQTDEPLTGEDNALIGQVWSLMADELAKQQEEELSNRWYKSQGLATNPEARAFQVANMGKGEQETLNRASEDWYSAKKQSAEGAFLAQRDQQQEQERIRLEKIKAALSGPRDWARYMEKTGETPTWLEYWMQKKETQSG